MQVPVEKIRVLLNMASLFIHVKFLSLKTFRKDKDGLFGFVCDVIIEPKMRKRKLSEWRNFFNSIEMVL